jgi:CRISPR-associated endoribonuclease Cas6
VRLQLEFQPLQDETILDINYPYKIASLIYRAIERANPSLSLELHKPNRFKFFTFSRLEIPGRKFKIDGKRLIIYSRAKLYFSTLNPEIGVSLVDGLLSKPEIKIGGAEFVVSEIKVMKEKEIGKKEIFSTLSPISVTTVEDNGRKRIVDLYPDSKKFYDNLRQNLVKKYREFYGKEPESCELRIRVRNVKAKRIKIKNTFHRCVEMVFVAEGSRELMEVGYKAGFGERNSMGFGMVKVV